MQQDRARIGLMTSLPVYWAGEDMLSSLQTDGEEAHWARIALEDAYALEPLDALEPEPLAQTDILILAQPRVLSPQENVALDDWVRGGGSALVFADPALVLESELPLGDPRRPMDSALLSPILGRWGLELTFDPAMAGSLRRVSDGDIVLDLAAAGAFSLRDGEDASCRLSAERVLAHCTIGKGRAILVADATLLEDREGTTASRDVLLALIDRVSNGTGEIAGGKQE